MRAPCVWCKGPVDVSRRRDAKTCSQQCRQKAHRFSRAVAPAARQPSRLEERAGAARRFAYADPPYPGLARRYYRCAEVDHVALVARLVDEFPDGWALSTSAAALPVVLPLCPPSARVCAWVRGSRPGVALHARSAWEPLIVFGGRPCRRDVDERLDDVLILSPSSRARSMPGACTGMKPAAFSSWLFALLGARPGDELADLFPGSGAVERAWEAFQQSSRVDAPGARDVSRRSSATGAP